MRASCTISVRMSTGVLRLHDLVEVVVEVGRQNRRARRRAEADDASLAERTLLGIVVGVGAFEPWVVFANGLVRRRPEDARRIPCLRFIGELGDAAVWRVDEERCALASVDRRVARSGIEPEIVVAADVAVRPRRPIAARRRRGAIGVDRRVEFLAPRGHLLLEILCVFVGQHQRRAGAAFERRERAEIVRALQVRTSILKTRNAPGCRRLFHGSRLPRDVYVCHEHRRRDRRRHCDTRQESVTHGSLAFPCRFYIRGVQFRAANRYYRSLTVRSSRIVYLGLI